MPNVPRPAWLLLATILLTHPSEVWAAKKSRVARLIDAVVAGDQKKAAALLRRTKPDVVNGRSERFGTCALGLAANLGSESMVNLLLRHGADPNCDNGAGQRPLDLAMTMPLVGDRCPKEETTEKILQALLKAGAQVDAPQYSYPGTVTALRDATLVGARCQRVLLDAGADPNAKDGNGRTALFDTVVKPPWVRAVDKESDQTLQRAATLIEYGADVNVVDRKGYTALAWALVRGYPRTASLLIEHGAKTSDITADGGDALMLAAGGGNLALVQRFLAEGFVPSRRDKQGRNALTRAAGASHNALEIVELLLAHGAKPETEAETGWSPLMAAALFGNDDVLAFLLQRGADHRQRLVNGRTLLWVAAAGGDVATLKRVLALPGVTHKERDEGGDTPLHAAARERNAAAVKVLLGSGANVRAVNDKDETALDVAFDCSDPRAHAVIGALVSAGADEKRVANGRCSSDDLVAVLKHALAARTFKPDLVPRPWSAILWAGGAAGTDLDSHLTGWQSVAPVLEERLRLAPGYPIRLKGEGIAGLARDSEWIVLGLCEEKEVERPAALLKASSDRVQVRKLTHRLEVPGCPVVLNDAQSRVAASSMDGTGRRLSVGVTTVGERSRYVYLYLDVFLYSPQGKLEAHKRQTLGDRPLHCKPWDLWYGATREDREVVVDIRCVDIPRREIYYRKVLRLSNRGASLRIRDRDSLGDHAKD